jgi:hypothetical protein
VSGLESWLARRRPEPPSDLGAALRPAGPSGSGVDRLTEAGRARLDEARDRTGRVRQSAFRLLEADALLTYACEAALETEDPDAALRRILQVIGG